MKAHTTTLPDVCPCLEKLGDAAALIDRRRRLLSWATSAFRELPAPLGSARAISQLEAVLPGLASSLARDGEATRRLSGGDHQWQAEIAPLDADYWLIRITDRHEQSRVLQRQLDDREQLLFTSRTLSVGEMATTLAHELNQPIGATANLLRGLRSRLARRQAGLGDDEAQALDRAIEQVMFASRIITRIRQFTHAHQPHPERFDLGGLLRDSVSLLDWDLRRSGTRLTLDLPSSPTRVSGDRVMLQQVFVNLIRNALDAMRGAPPADPHLQLRLVPLPHELVVEVCDNGCGLDESTESRLFVPFASSKPNGMGIGLSICRSFIELHQGRLWFSRNPTRGTTFHVGLPPLNAATPARGVAAPSVSNQVAA